MSKVFYTHFDLPRGVITVAHQLDEDNNEVRAGFAFCAPSDNFCRSDGRNIAHIRLIDEPLCYCCSNLTKPIVKTAEEALNLFVDTQWSQVPQWIRQIINRDKWFLSIRVKRARRLLRKRLNNGETRKNDKVGTTNC